MSHSVPTPTSQDPAAAHARGGSPAVRLVSRHLSRTHPQRPSYLLEKRKVPGVESSHPVHCRTLPITLLQQSSLKNQAHAGKGGV